MVYELYVAKEVAKDTNDEEVGKDSEQSDVVGNLDTDIEGSTEKAT